MGVAGVPFQFNTINNYAIGVYDLEVYVNGVKVMHTAVGPNMFEINEAYAIEASDVLMVVGVMA